MAKPIPKKGKLRFVCQYLNSWDMSLKTYTLKPIPKKKQCWRDRNHKGGLWKTGGRRGICGKSQGGSVKNRQLLLSPTSLLHSAALHTISIGLHTEKAPAMDLLCCSHARRDIFSVPIFQVQRRETKPWTFKDRRESDPRHGLPGGDPFHATALIPPN